MPVRFPKALAGLAVFAVHGTALAAPALVPLAGTFEMTVYQFAAGGSGTNADADLTYIKAHAIAPLTSLSYTGVIDFHLAHGATNTIGAFLASGGGTVHYIGPDISGTKISTGHFATTTIFDIKGSTPAPRTGSVSHDDGVSIYSLKGNTSTTVLDSKAPTSEKSNQFTLPAGKFEIVYSAANDLPEVLRVKVNPIPEPASALLLGAGLLGLGAIRRRAR